MEVAPPAERLLNSNNAIGEKSSVSPCCSVFARRDGHLSSMRSPLIVNGIKLLHETFPHLPDIPIDFAPD